MTLIKIIGRKSPFWNTSDVAKEHCKSVRLLMINNSKLLLLLQCYIPRSEWMWDYSVHTRNIMAARVGFGRPNKFVKLPGRRWVRHKHIHTGKSALIPRRKRRASWPTWQIGPFKMTAQLISISSDGIPRAEEGETTLVQTVTYIPHRNRCSAADVYTNSGVDKWRRRRIQIIRQLRCRNVTSFTMALLLWHYCCLSFTRYIWAAQGVVNGGFKISGCCGWMPFRVWKLSEASGSRVT